MIPGARAQAAIEILDEVIAAARGGGAAADTIVQRYFKTRRYAGSKDRRAVREFVYRAIRAWPEVPPSGRAALLGLAPDDAELLSLFDGSPHGPAPVKEGEAEIRAEGTVPGWLTGRFDPLIGQEEAPALLGRAPLDVRVNPLRGTREEAQAALGGEPTPLSPLGLRLPEGSPVEASGAFGSGLVEVQDEGSQLLALACGAGPDQTVVDLCAGAGGKTLALAAEMRNRGRLVACDVDRGRLTRMRPRLERAGVSILEPRLLDPRREREALGELRAAADVVLVDAPCSGTGTWRRNPELRWRLTADRLTQLVNLQSYILDLAAELVRPGGILVYAVCSVLAEEGRGQAEAFGARSSMVPETVPIPGGRPAGPGLILTPGHDGTDGFFVARWRATC